MYQNIDEKETKQRLDLQKNMKQDLADNQK
jgi:hypothetical protein